MSILKMIDGRELDTKGKEDLLAQVGNLSRKPSSVIRSIREAHGIPHEKAVRAEAGFPKPKGGEKKNESDVPELIIG